MDTYTTQLILSIIYHKLVMKSPQMESLWIKPVQLNYIWEKFGGGRLLGIIIFDVGDVFRKLKLFRPFLLPEN